MKKRLIISTMIISLIGILIIFFSTVSFEKFDTSNELPASSFLEKMVSENDSFIRTDYVDAQGNIAFAQDQYFATKIETLDENGNVILEEYFDENGDRACQKLKYYQLKKVYNERNQNIEEQYLNKKGKLVNNKNGYAIVKKEYNEEGLVEKETYYDTNGDPVMNKSNYHGKIFEYNDLDQAYKITFIGIDNQPIDNKNNICVTKREFYEDGSVKKEMYYDSSNKHVLLASGHSGVLKEYDAYGRNVTTITLDQNGNPFMNPSGYSTIKRTFYQNNEEKAKFYYDIDGNPTATTKGNYGMYCTKEKNILLDQNNKEVFNIQRFLTNNEMIVVLIVIIVICITLLVPKKYIWILLGMSILSILYLTLFNRAQTNLEPKFELFWSYKQFFTDKTLQKEILLNILLFLPLGYLLSFITKNKRYVLLAILFSVCIEIVQLVFGLGVFEYDDMISNGIGSVLGYAIGYFITKFLNER